MGHTPYLENVIQLNLSQISAICRALHLSASRGNLKASWTAYVKWGKGNRTPLRFSKSGDPALERRWATHYLPARRAESDDKPARIPENPCGETPSIIASDPCST